MRRRDVLCLLWTALFVRVDVLASAEADPAILGSDLPLLQQNRPTVDPRPRLSASQQAQILSDVQQHQQRYRRPQHESAAFPSLARYKVDRTKQQQLQQLIQQQQQVQQLIQQQQQKIAQQLAPSLTNVAQTPFQPQLAKQQYQQQQQRQLGAQYPNAANAYQNLHQDLGQPLYGDDQATVQLQSYLEKQRELELLQKQRQQLLLEQQELRRQQELLRLQRLQQLTSTTATPSPSPSTVFPSTATNLNPIVSTTTPPILLSSPTARRITPSEAELFLKAIASHQKKYATTAGTTTTTTTTTTTRPATVRTVSEPHQENPDIPDNLLTLIREQERRLTQQGKPKPQIKVIYQTDRPTTRQGPTSRARSSQYNSSVAQTPDKELLLKQLRLALAQSGDDDEASRNVTTRDLILPNGKKLQVIRAPNDLPLIGPTADGTDTIGTSTRVLTQATTTIRPPKAIFEELTKGVLPPGADFEVIRQKSDGRLEEVGRAPIQSLPAKKVTFVVLEEQPDGSYKVQGVKGNADKESGGDVESIVERIKKGELKLPPSSLNPTTAASPLEYGSSLDPNSLVTARSSGASSPASHPTSHPTTFGPTTVRSASTFAGHESKSTSDYVPYVTVSPNSLSSTDKYVTSASSVTGHVYNSIGGSGTSTRSGSTEQEARTTARYPTTATRSSFVPTMAPVNEIVTTTPAAVPTTFSHASTYVRVASHRPAETSAPSGSVSSTTRASTGDRTGNTVYRETFERTTPSSNDASSSRASDSLAGLLRREGLFAMAKYLGQSGLDGVLNETGPYTIFVPTDKAFRTLLVQLGGPEKAEQKFRDNPRLLSGLLLHHVIPGAFRIDSLQDEMTGVSLAGTQLRVNEYAMHDHEWNDVKVTTINGARVAPNKRNIEIPQGIAHAVDRVMFPLPVGDLVQTLQADRERRFTTFLKMLHASGLEDTLAGPKTFTVFAPTDSAFVAAATKNGTPVWSEEDGPEAAKTIISKHVVPTTLYTAGMRYYLQKDTLRPQVPIHVHKNGGRVKINEAHVVTHNVPATNGVLHAIDGVL